MSGPKETVDDAVDDAVEAVEDAALAEEEAAAAQAASAGAAAAATGVAAAEAGAALAKTEAALASQRAAADLENSKGEISCLKQSMENQAAALQALAQKQEKTEQAMPLILGSLTELRTLIQPMQTQKSEEVVVEEVKPAKKEAEADRADGQNQSNKGRPKSTRRWI